MQTYADVCYARTKQAASTDGRCGRASVLMLYLCFTYSLLIDSHYDALKDMTANGYATALLLEDDAVLHERFPALLQASLANSRMLTYAGRMLDVC